MHNFERLDPDKIKANLHTKRIGKEVIVFNSTSSTNDIAWEYARSGNSDGLVIFAEQQTGGRGRGSNKWLSEHGKGLLLSIILTELKIDTELLSLVCAVSLAESLWQQAAIKWPNDILLNGKKAAGILIESRNQKFVIGVGINCHQKQFPEEIKDIATSIDIETGGICERNIIAKRILCDFEHWLETAEKNSQKIIEKWNQLSVQLHHRVCVMYNRKKYCGTCIGIDPQKGLIVQLEGSAVRFFEAAHTSIVK